ncbi:hypothetical protein PY650_34345 [Rhizobium calliandrae]|uniref:Uncharacterized protein n=1 Tax=Rhizobium calliandrae TaxID=1312182 RepID=A0ABT7KPR1_9HYPH|nr:hypothetical protein [Rhizobium calliandrae]MDL2410572.1 hypothetical protein [Rhizobium calliandrae]
MSTSLVERLTGCVGQIEEFSQRISRIQAGEVHHQAQFGDGPWEDITAIVLTHYEHLLEDYKYFAEDLRRRIENGES